MDMNERFDNLAKALTKDMEWWAKGMEAHRNKKFSTEEQLAEVAEGEASKLLHAWAKDMERRQGKKLFTEEQLAEVAQEVGKASMRFEVPEGLYDAVASAFHNTTDKMVDPGRTPVYKAIIEAIRTIQHAAWENSKAHGWNEAVDNPASALMMITREVSELAEEERDVSSGESTKTPGFSKKEEEAADIAIRLLSYCGARNMRLGEAICAKHEFNKTRPYRHGDKLF